jgi:glycerol-3-phosphate O-acyltransferase
VVEDEARDAEYTRMLGERVLGAYRRAAVALPSSVVAFALFERLRSTCPQLDIFRLLRVLGAHTPVRLEELRPVVAATLAELRALATRGAITLAPELRGPSLDAVIERGLETLSSYHYTPALRRSGGAVEVGDPALLFYYRNRLDGYGLLESPSVCEMLSRRARGGMS